MRGVLRTVRSSTFLSSCHLLEFNLWSGWNDANVVWGEAYVIQPDPYSFNKTLEEVRERYLSTDYLEYIAMEHRPGLLH